jgi:hypothetical protein
MGAASARARSLVALHAVAFIQLTRVSAHCAARESPPYSTCDNSLPCHLRKAPRTSRDIGANCALTRIMVIDNRCPQKTRM